MTIVFSDKKIYLCSLWLYFIAVPLGAMNIGSFGSLLKLFGLLPVVSALLISRNYKPINLQWLYFGYVLLVTLSIGWSINSPHTIGRAITLFELFLLMLSVSAVEMDENDLVYLKKALVWSSRITVVLLLATGSLWEGRLVLQGAIDEDPNYLCMYFSFGAVNAVEKIFSEKKMIKKVIYAFEDLIYIYAVLLSGSRGGLLALMACLLTGILTSNNSKLLRGGKIFIRLIIIFLLFYAIYYLLAELSPLLVERFTINAVVESGGTGRTKIWKNGLELFNNSSLLRKVFGHGAATNMRAMQLAGYYNAAVMHNIFLETLLELGIIGFIYYILMIVSFVVSALKIQNKYSFCIIVGFIIMSLSTSLYAFKPYINIMIYIIISIRVMNKTQDDIKNGKTKRLERLQ